MPVSWCQQPQPHLHLLRWHCRTATGTAQSDAPQAVAMADTSQAEAFEQPNPSKRRKFSAPSSSRQGSGGANAATKGGGAASATVVEGKLEEDVPCTTKRGPYSFFCSSRSAMQCNCTNEPLL